MVVQVGSATAGGSVSASVVGMGGSSVPTVGVEEGKREDGEGGNDDSMVEEVGRMVDESRQQQQHGQQEQEQEQEAAPRNPKKRMWEGDVEAKKREQEQEQKTKDEL